MAVIFTPWVLARALTNFMIVQNGSAYELCFQVHKEQTRNFADVSFWVSAQWFLLIFGLIVFYFVLPFAMIYAIYMVYKTYGCKPLPDVLRHKPKPEPKVGDDKSMKLLSKGAFTLQSNLNSETDSTLDSKSMGKTDPIEAKLVSKLNNKMTNSTFTL